MKLDSESSLKSEVRHVVAYVQRSKITDWKRLMDPGVGEAFPFLYGSRDSNVFAEYVQKGTVLWVFSSTPGARPPSLVAKLQVIGRADDPGGETYGVPPSVLRAFRESKSGKERFRYIAVGHPKHSRFYGYNNASHALLSLVLKWKHTHRTLSGESPYPEGTGIWQSSYAFPLNRPAIVVSDPALLENLHRAATRSLFISWKRGDNWKRRNSIRELAYALADEGLFTWLDIFAFPPSIALKTKVDPNAELLERLLKYGYDRCKGLLAIETRHYGEPGISGNWTEKEWTGHFEEGKTPHPLPLRWIYRFEKSAFLTKSAQETDLLIPNVGWNKVAKIIGDKMKESVLLPI